METKSIEYEKPVVELSIIENEHYFASSTLEDLEKGGEWDW